MTEPNTTEPVQPEREDGGLDTPPSTAEAPSAQIAVRDALSVAGINGRIRYARELANANLLPSSYRRQPANVLYAVEYGLMLGVHPMAAITGVHVIDGKPTASPALMSALVRTAGHKLRVKVTGTVEDGTLKATATLIRSDDPDHPFEASWTLQDAERAELCSLAVDQQGRTVITARDRKGNRLPWEKYPKAMVKARSIGEVCREGAEEVLCGAHYTPEELGAMVNEEGEVIEGEVVGESLTQQDKPEPPKPMSPEQATAIRKTIFGAFDQPDPRAVLVNLWESTERTRGVTKVLDHTGKEVTVEDLIKAAGAVAAEGGRLTDTTEQATPAASAAPVDADGIQDAEVVDEPTSSVPSAQSFREILDDITKTGKAGDPRGALAVLDKLVQVHGEQTLNHVGPLKARDNSEISGWTAVGMVREHLNSLPQAEEPPATEAPAEEQAQGTPQEPEQAPAAEPTAPEAPAAQEKAPEQPGGPAEPQQREKVGKPGWERADWLDELEVQAEALGKSSVEDLLGEHLATRGKPLAETATPYIKAWAQMYRDDAVAAFHAAGMDHEAERMAGLDRNHAATRAWVTGE